LALYHLYRPTPAQATARYLAKATARYLAKSKQGARALIAIFFVASMLALGTAGCAHPGYKQANGVYAVTISAELNDPKWYAQYYSDGTTPAVKMELRNRLINYCIWLADKDFNRYADRFSNGQAWVNTAADWASLALTGASAVGSPAYLYGQIAMGIQGAHSAYGKDALDQQPRSAILLRMDALRQEKLAEIYSSELAPDDQYSLIQGLIDVQQYASDGTVRAALEAIAEDASTSKQNARVALKALRK
jgi:hypothetical protein